MLDRKGIRGIILGGGIFIGCAVLPLVRGRSKKVRPSVVDSASRTSPNSLEVVIPAYLEAGPLPATISRIRQEIGSWPGQSLITVVASDSDTAKSARGADRVIEVERCGKPSAINKGVELSTADIIVLMDANCAISPSGWSRILFDDLQVADLVSASKSERGGREAAYWKYEKVLSGEQGLNDSLAVVGEFLAFRRADFLPVPVNAQLDDFWIAHSFFGRGKRVCVDSRITTQEDEASIRDQWERRVRIASGFYSEVVPNVGSLLRSRVGLDYALHKPLRMTVGAAGFWLAAFGAFIVAPPVSCLATAVVFGSAIAAYATGSPKFIAGRMLTSAIALQLVPPAGLFRALQGRRKDRGPGWRKIPR